MTERCTSVSLYRVYEHHLMVCATKSMALTSLHGGQDGVTESKDLEELIAILFMVLMIE